MLRLTKTALLCSALSPLCGCGAGSSSTSSPDTGQPFQYRATEEVAIGVLVEKHGAPVEGATVTIVAASASDSGADSAAQAQGTLYFHGGTDETGSCRALVAIPTNRESVDVIVQHDGSGGPYSDESLRTRWGPFAPSSRITVAREFLDSVAIRLEDH